MVGGDETGRQDAFRIDAITADPDDAEIALYTLATKDPATGEWRSYCVPDDRGVAGGFFLSGSWDARGTHLRDSKFSVTCTSGVIGKCVRAGYKPWKMAPDGRPMWDYHQACTRLVRADYCGNGRAHTRDGVQIEIIDRFKPEEEPDGGRKFEAAWTPEGASCVARPRLVTWSLEAIAAECPKRVSDPATCTMTELDKPDVLLVNKSPLGTR